MTTAIVLYTVGFFISYSMSRSKKDVDFLHMIPSTICGLLWPIVIFLGTITMLAEIMHQIFKTKEKKE